MRLDREDADFEEAASGIFEEGGVERFADDVFVDLAGLGGIKEFGGDLGAVDLHGEVVDVGSSGEGKEECAFEALRGVVLKDLENLSRGDLILDLDLDLLTF